MMVKGPKTASTVQKLLDERLQIQRWLERLSMASEAAPEHVQSKVRQDYERRLQEVMQELEGHGKELERTLERQRGVRGELAGQESGAAERLAEAELRHAVGEYTETQWRQIHSEMLEALVKIREELKEADEEIVRLQEVVTLIESQSAPPPAPAPPPRDEPAAPPVAPAPIRKVTPPPRPAHPASVDELAFLRSVTEDNRQGPSPSRASGSTRAISDSGPRPVSPVNSDKKADALPRTSKQLRSLKCKECGTLNLPTEWYCERCGAELAAV